MVKFQIPNSNTFRDMNYYPVTDGWTDRQKDGQKVMHKSPPCNMHRWGQKADFQLPYGSIWPMDLVFMSTFDDQSESIG